MQRVNSRVIKRLIGILLEFAVESGPQRGIFPRVFLPARCGRNLRYYGTKSANDKIAKGIDITVKNKEAMNCSCSIAEMPRSEGKYKEACMWRLTSKPVLSWVTIVS